jgi:hypothetical protein
MRNFYPSKWFAIIVFTLLGIGLVVGLFYLYKHDIDSARSQTGPALQGEDADISKLVAESDRDKDGLHDWEETLWHTDPDNPDTDGDGTKDGAEVLQNRDPAVSGPNDDLDRLNSKTQNSLVAGTSTTSTTLGMTETVARELFGSYLILKQGGKFDTEAQSKLIAAVSESVTKQTNLQPYTLTNLNIVTGTPAHVAAYGEAMRKVFTKFFEIGETQQNELILLKEALQTKNYTVLPTIATSATIYANLSLQLRNTPVPKDIASDHLILVNGYQVYADMTKAMSEVQRDPIKVIVYIGQYQDIEKAGQQAVANINAYVATHSSQ